MGYDRVMKRLLAFLILIGLAYGGYIYYSQLTALTRTSTPLETQGKLIISHASDSMGSLASVLGANISNLIENSQGYISGVTGGAEGPLINELVTKTQETLKDLPRKEAEKIKYEFCRGIVTEYENKSEVKEENP